MDRTLTYKITKQDAGYCIEQYLRYRGYSYRNLEKLKMMNESVMLNGVWHHLDKELCEGDILEIRIQERESSEHIPPTEIPLNIVYEDEDILVVNKPAGMPIHPSKRNYYYSLGNALAWYYEQQGKPFIFRCTNRLDTDTSGLTIVAKHLVSGTLLNDMVRNHTVSREYRAIVRGKVNPPAGTIDAPIGRKQGPIIERVIDFEEGEQAVTHYQVLEEKKGHSLVALHLETGRTHQIRIHMKHLGFPIIGDYLYNPDMEFMTRQALHSYQMKFTHPITGEKMEFIAPLPEDMKIFDFDRNF